MALCLSLYFPFLPLEIFTRGQIDSSQASVVTSLQRGQPWVHLASEQALQQGVTPGMGLSAAQALVDSLHSFERDLDRELETLHHIAACAYQYSSWVSLQGSQAIILEIEGSLRLFGGEKVFWQKLKKSINALGYQLQSAVAPTPLAAYLLARWQQQYWLSDKDEMKNYMSRLPLAALELTPEAHKQLQGYGAKTLADILRLPRGGLIKRLGAATINYLDRILGEQADPRETFELPKYFKQSFDLVSETDNTDTLLFVGRRLLVSLEGFLRSHGAGAQQFYWRLQHQNQADTQFVLRTIGITRSVQHLQQLLQERLQNLQLKAAYTSVSLRVRQIQPFDEQSEDFWQKQSTSDDANLLLERLQNRLGQEAVQGLSVWADHRPERASRFCRIGEKTAVQAPILVRPLWLLPTPKILQMQQGLPVYRGRLQLRRGPERIETGWWDGYDVRRDYYIAHNPKGECLWIFHTSKPKPCWYLHGIFA
ncbi:MAG: DNA polymerase Y family protein [Gammaproteobacteria bacterium]|nr:DNA polymerase Y family protein [Gammaproteobacteria bacterium]